MEKNAKTWAFHDIGSLLKKKKKSPSLYLETRQYLS